ncbi:MAG: NAD(P)/FAD-dependent oxidoreductase [Pseudomonadota bacterium]
MTIAAWLEQFSAALENRNIDCALALFGTPAYWRDMVAFTWNIHTAEGADAIETMLRSQLDQTAPRNWQIDGPVNTSPEGFDEAWLTFETAIGEGKAHVRLKDGKAYTLLTTLTALRDHPTATDRNRPRGQSHGAARGRKHWHEIRAEAKARIGREHDPYVVIIGGGQGGMSLGARLGHLGVPYIILETNARAGDSWRNRYPSLCLHDPVWYDHMPFIPFPPDWPVFTPRDRMADWLEMYARVMDLNYWTSSRCAEARYDDAAGVWDITIDRAGETVKTRAAHLVFATGMSGYPHVPEFPGQEDFEGLQVHSSAYPGGREFAGRRAVVIGSNTSAHDIAADLWENGADVTMLQRSGTLVTQSETVMECLLGALYSEDALARGIDTETADFAGTTWPHRVLEERHKQICATMKARDRDLHDRLRAAGFILDFGPDETGLAMKSIRQGGGFYINVGASELIADGDVKLRSGIGISRFSRDHVVLSDGSSVVADMIVYATGYRSMNEFVADIVGRDVAERVGRCWGVGSGIEKDPGPWEGELRNMWKPTGQEGLWFQGGNLAQSRHFSRFLALQLKARHVGLPTPVFAPPVQTEGIADRTAPALPGKADVNEVEPAQ